MGKYYDWVNIDKKEYISPYDFDLGSKLYETTLADNHLLGALYDLLASDWKGDAIVFLADEVHITPEDDNPVLQRLSAERHAAWGDEPGYDADYVIEEYKCISGLFKEAEETVRQEIDRMVRTLVYAVLHHYTQPQNFYGVGGLKIFRDLIYEMQGLMKEDHRFYKEHGFYDFPQKKKGRIAGMYLVSAMMNSEKIQKKMNFSMTDGMMMPYRKVLDQAKESAAADCSGKIKG